MQDSVMNDEEKEEGFLDANITCPFCGEEGFDKIGLKNHLFFHCAELNNTPDIERNLI